MSDLAPGEGTVPPPPDDLIDYGSYVYIEDGPRGDDEGMVLLVATFTVAIYSEVHLDRIAYPRHLVRLAATD